MTGKCEWLLAKMRREDFVQRQSLLLPINFHIPRRLLVRSNSGVHTAERPPGTIADSLPAVK